MSSPDTLLLNEPEKFQPSRSSEREGVLGTAANSHTNSKGLTWKLAGKAKTGNQIWGRREEKGTRGSNERSKNKGTHRDTHRCQPGGRVGQGEERSREIRVSMQRQLVLALP